MSARIFKPLCFAALLLLVPVMIAADFQVVKNARIPEYSEDGVLQTMIYAKVAKIPKKAGAKKALIEGLKIDLYKENEIDATIQAENCTYEREKRFARSKDDVSIETGEMHITGKEFAYDGTKDRFVIFSNVRVEIKQANAFAMRPAEPDATAVPAPSPQPTIPPPTFVP